MRKYVKNLTDEQTREKNIANLGEAKYECPYCHEKYANMTWVTGCMDKHGLMYVPMTHADIVGLLHLIWSGDPSAISEQFVVNLQKFNKIRPLK